MTLSTVSAPAGARALSDVAARPWDVVVVGAGPAGALTARQLAGGGRAVLLVDRRPFPRWKVCGACVGGGALATLEAAGLAGTVDALPAVALDGLEIAGFGRHARLPLSGGRAICRRDLDAALVEAARHAGATFLPGARAVATASASRDEAPELELDTGADAVRLRPRLVVAADGLAGTFRRGLARGRDGDTRAHGADGHGSGRSRVGAGAVFAGAPSAYRAGTVHMAVGNAGYVGVVRRADGGLNVAAALDPRRVRAGGGPGSVVEELLEAAGWPSPSGPARSAWRGTPALTRRASPVPAPGVLAVGDATGYVEPFTGEGIAWALEAAVLLAGIARQVGTVPFSGLAAAWQRTFEARLRRERLACRGVAWLTRHPGLARVALALLARAPAVAAPLVRHLHGRPQAAGGQPA